MAIRAGFEPFLALGSSIGFRTTRICGRRYGTLSKAKLQATAQNRRGFITKLTKHWARRVFRPTIRGLADTRSERVSEEARLVGQSLAANEHTGPGRLQSRLGLARTRT
jgi:hypothetical protein